MTYEDRGEMLEEANEMLHQCIDLIVKATRGTNRESEARSYIIPHLGTWVEYGDRQSGILDYADDFYTQAINGEY